MNTKAREFDTKPVRRLIVKAKVPSGRGDETFWRIMGVANEMPDGVILLRITALPLNWDGNAKLFVDEGHE